MAWSAVRHIPETRDFSATGRLDYVGAALLALGLVGITYTLIEASGGGSTTDVALVAALGVIALAAFAWQERRRRDPILPFEIFRSRQFSAANAVTFVIYAGLGGFFFLFVSFLRVSLGYSPVEAGAASLPVTALMLVFSAWAGGLAERIGARIPLTVGSVVIGLALLAMTTISPGDGYLTGVLPPVLLFRRRSDLGRRAGDRGCARGRRRQTGGDRVGGQQRGRPRRRALRRGRPAGPRRHLGGGLLRPEPNVCSGPVAESVVTARTS